jgi:WD40 repeat protein
MKCLQPLPRGFLAGCGDSHKINIYEPDSGHFKMLTGHTADVAGLRLTPSGDLMSSGYDRSFLIWDFVSGECLKKIDLTAGNYEAMIALPGNRFACKLYEGTAIRFYGSNMEVLCSIDAKEIHKSTKKSEIFIHLENDRFASACGSTVRIFDFQKKVKTEKPSHVEWLVNYDIIKAQDKLDS